MNQHIALSTAEELERDQLLRAQRRREKYEDILAEIVTRKLDHMQTAAEELASKANELVRLGYDISDELEEMETFENAFHLVRLLLVRANNQAE